MRVDNQKSRSFKDERFGNDKPTKNYHYQQRRRIKKEERIGLECVQSFINTISFPTSLAELLYFSDCLSLVDEVRTSTEVEWTVPKWAKAGDIVFFMHAKTARSTITKLRTELLATKDDYSVEAFSAMMSTISHGLETHSLYGGKIFAIGRVAGGPEYSDTEDNYSNLVHWNSRHYAAIDNIIQLDFPIDISSFNDFITVTRGAAITPIWGNDFEKLKNVIAETNVLPWYVAEAQSRPVPLRKINRENWIYVANDYRRSFILESQFRSFYVDYLLRSIGDMKHFYSECRCTKPGINDSFIDNIIKFDGKYLSVEVKLSVPSEQNINAQVSKYCNNSVVYLDSKGKTASQDEIHFGKVLVIDTDYLYIYDYTSDSIKQLFALDAICCFRDLDNVKSAIRGALV